MKPSTIATVLCLVIALCSCRTVGRGLVRTGGAIGGAGVAAGDWSSRQPKAVRVIAYPFTAASAIAGAAIGLPIMWVGAAFGGTN